MSWVTLATRLGLHIALGYLAGLLVLGGAPLGKFFYRLTGWTAAVVAGLAGAVALAGGIPEHPAERLRVLATGALALPAPLYVSARPGRRRLGLALGLACGATALAAFAFGPYGVGLRQLASDAASAAVAGGVCFAMVFGHGYLTVPKLPFAPLQRINRFTAAALALRLALLALCVALAWPRWRATPAFGMFDWFFLGVRVVVGLLLPLLFAAMVASALRWRNNQSATGIWYASTVLVWIGEAIALHLGQAWREAL